MREVEIQRLVEREGDGIVVEGHVDLGLGVGDGVVLEAGEDFLLETDADGAAGLGSEGVVAVKLEVVGVAEADPFFIGEKGAEAAVAACDLQKM